MKNLSNLHIALLFFVVFSLLSILDLGTMGNRVLRVIPNVFALGFVYFAFTPKVHKYPLYFLIALLISAILSFFFENQIFGLLTLVFAFIAYCIVGFAAIKQLSKIKANWFLRIYFIITLIVLGYFLFEVTQIGKDQYSSYLQFILFNINNLALIFMLASALLLVHQNPTQIAMVFLGFVVVLILSEVLRAASYYSPEKVNVFFYGCRVLYVLALALLINCCGLIEKQFLKQISQ